MTVDMATSAYLSQAGSGPSPAAGPGPGAPSDQENEGVMNLVNTSASQGYTLPREQVVGHQLQSRNIAEK